MFKHEQFLFIYSPHTITPHETNLPEDEVQKLSTMISFTHSYMYLCNFKKISYKSLQLTFLQMCVIEEPLANYCVNLNVSPCVMRKFELVVVIDEMSPIITNN